VPRAGSSSSGAPGGAATGWPLTSSACRCRPRSARRPPPGPARENALARFANGRPRVLVATDVAARGIHVENVEVVVHADPPEDHKAYLHRSGRTARAGAAGLVVSLVEWDQELAVRRLQRRLGLADIPQVEMFSNDPRLADLARWDPRAVA
jgi:superfamily II DNA/RNA helicase